MYANYHTHTSLCHHATGEMEEYVENAIKSGIKILGFSDHAPYLFDGDHYSHFRMRPEETEKYVKDIDTLRQKYKKDITIYTGFEIEYYPDLFERTLEFLKGIGYDFLILGQHALNNEYDKLYSYNPERNKDDFVCYVNQVIEGMKTGEFLYLAHPDVIFYYDNPEFYAKEMLRLCECAKKLNIPLELNLLGIREERMYPYDEFWKLAAEVGNDVIFGIDAHDPLHLSDTKTIDMAYDYVKKFGITPLEELKIK